MKENYVLELNAREIELDLLLSMIYAHAPASVAESKRIERLEAKIIQVKFDKSLEDESRKRHQRANGE